MDCICIKTEGVGRRFICDRTDPHPADYGVDREGHHWVKATDEQWAAANAALNEAWERATA